MRRDAWTSEEDARLAEIVLHHVKVGSTQLDGFEEAGDAFGRTSAACGFRWNSMLRRNYEEQLQSAKTERRARVRRPKRREVPAFVLEKLQGSRSAAQAIQSLTEYVEELQGELKTTKEELYSVKEEKTTLEKRIGEFMALARK